MALPRAPLGKQPGAQSQSGQTSLPGPVGGSGRLCRVGAQDAQSPGLAGPQPVEARMPSWGNSGERNVSTPQPAGDPQAPWPVGKGLFPTQPLPFLLLKAEHSTVTEPWDHVLLCTHLVASFSWAAPSQHAHSAHILSHLLQHRICHGTWTQSVCPTPIGTTEDPRLVHLGPRSSGH